MTKQPARSPFLDGEDLLRTHIGCMSLGELEAHAEAIRRVLVRLIDAIASSHLPSSIAMAGGNRLVKKLIAHLDDVLDLIGDLQADAAEADRPMAESAQSAGGAGYRPPKP